MSQASVFSFKEKMAGIEKGSSSYERMSRL